MVDGAAGDALMMRVLQGMLRLTVALVMTTVRALRVMVLGMGPRMGGPRRIWALALATPGRGPGKRCRLVGSPVLAVLVASGVRAAPRQSWRRVPLVRLMVRVVQVLHRLMPRVRVL